MGWGWWGEGVAGEWEKKEKGEGEKQQRRGQKVDEEGGDMKCEFKFIWMESGWGREELAWI